MHANMQGLLPVWIIQHQIWTIIMQLVVPVMMTTAILHFSHTLKPQACSRGVDPTWLKLIISQIVNIIVRYSGYHPCSLYVYRSLASVFNHSLYIMHANKRETLASCVMPHAWKGSIEWPLPLTRISSKRWSLQDRSSPRRGRGLETMCPILQLI